MMKKTEKIQDRQEIINGTVYRYIGRSAVMDYFEDQKGYLFCREIYPEGEARLIRCGHRSEHNEMVEKFGHSTRINFQYKSFTERIEVNRKRKRIIKKELQTTRTELMLLPVLSGKRDRLQVKIHDLEQEEVRLKAHIELLIILTGERSDRKEEIYA